jgi:hypothetical protein
LNAASAEYFAHDDGGRISRSGIRALGHLFVWVSLFTMFFVQREPAPYDLLILVAAGLYFLCGLSIPKRLAGLVLLMIGFVAGGFLSLTQVPEYDPFFFHLVTTYLAITAIFIAAFVAADPARRLPIVMNAYLCAALVASALAIAGYLGMGGESLTRYGRATATFKDPNVLGAFLIAPAAYAFTLALSRPVLKASLAMGCYCLIAIGVLLTFSRAAWIGTFLATFLVAVFTLAAANTHRERTRLIVIAAASLPLAALAIGFALSLDGVRDIVQSRTSLQAYDTAGSGGRFSGQIFGFAMAMEHPLGLGPYEFAKHHGADPHNVYLNALLSYGWLGAASYYLLVAMTLIFAWRTGVARGPLHVYAAPAAAGFIVIAAEGIIIDTDHWRHFFLLAGIVWGVYAASASRSSPALRATTNA